MSFAVAVWSYAYFLWQISGNQYDALLWIRILNIGSIFIPIFYVHWILVLLSLNKKNKKIIVFSYLSGVLFVLFSLSVLFVKGVKPMLMFKFWPQAGIVYTAYIIVYIFLVTYGLNKLIGSLKQYGGHKAAQVKYVIFGSIIGFAGGATNFFLWYNIPIPPYGNVLVALYTIILSYATIVHRFMDVKLALRRSSVFIASIISLIIPAFFIKYALYSLFSFSTTLLDTIILMIALAVFTPLKKYYYSLANKYFFSSLYDSKEVIEKISDRLSSTLEVKNVYTYVSDILANIFHARSLGILTYDEAKKEYILRHAMGLDASLQKKFKADPVLQKDFADQSNPIIVEELRHSAYRKYKNTINLLTSLGIEILMPLNVKNKSVGLLVLGPKESGDMYNDEDLDVLKVVGAQMAISLENGLLYEETKNFNKKLRHEIDIATADLKEANEKLKKLDEAKSEFISIASHQLRTPLTAIKGYISMMLEGDFGQLTEPEHDSLEKVFDSNERLIKLVENLLNISRIESGRLQFNFEEVQLEEMVGSVMEELSGSAKKKGLIIEYKKPEAELPKVNIDDEKIRQVVMNLIDNAIKYTKKGNITVSLRQDGNAIEFCVSDSGMGINPDDLPNLFQKFSRGTGTSLIHTEGTGLGLYVARQMMEAHHGKIWAESQGDGMGSRFCFRLPIIR